jgi:UDP-glucose 4-epimerase
MARYLVTGGAGFIGSHITTALVKRGENVRVLDDLSTGFADNLQSVIKELEFVEGDVVDSQTVAAAVKGVDCIFHQAALASVPMSIDNPMETNRVCVNGTLNVLNQARQAGVRRVVYAASSSVYGDSPDSPKREDACPMPLSPYAAAKAAGELYCKSFFHSYGLETVGLRYFNVFGPRQDPNSPYSAVIPIFVTRMLDGIAPVVYGDGQQTRDFTHVANIVHGNLLAAEAKEAAGKVMNVANGVSVSLLDLIKQLNRLLGTDIQPQHEAPRVGDVRESNADISLARKVLGYEPVKSFDEGLHNSIDYYRALVAR